MRSRLAAALLLVLVACGRADRREAAVPAPLSQAPSAGAWTWHPLGGLAVVEGEVGEPTDLVLEGPSILERRFAEPGPVRWEFFRPPSGESAVLRTAQGRELARFRFSLSSVPKPEPEAQRLAKQPKPPARPDAAAKPTSRSATQTASTSTSKPAPKPPAPKALPEPPAPMARVEARLRNLPVTPIPSRKSAALPSASETPARPPRRTSPFTPIQPDPVAPSAATPMAIPSPAAWPGMGEALNLTRGRGGQKRILLSFDGGSTAEVATEVLDLLKARGIHTTLFLTGAFIRRFPALVRRMAAEGHELGNHTMNHPHFAPGMKRDPKWTRERVQRELLDADAALVQLLGRPMDPYWRAPYGEHTAEIRRWAEELGYRHVGWSEGADTLDWATPKDRRLYRSGEAIVKRLQQRLGRDGDGLIVLMHLGSERATGDRPTDGLGAFMDRAQKEGWTFVSAGTLLRELGKPAWDPHQRLALLNASSAQGR